MTHAYDKLYLEKARTAMGCMLDFAVNDLGYDIDEFFKLFIGSGVATLFENGDSTVTVGMSGVELAYTVLDRSGIDYKRISPNYTVNRSEEYWTGWALAYYQWYTSLSFSEITRYISIKDILSMYSPYHEMDVRHFVDKLTDVYKNAKPHTNLKLQRKKLGLTQKELAELSGIPLRTIQQYEQRQKNINKAQIEYLLSLSKTLCCNIEALLEINE